MSEARRSLRLEREGALASVVLCRPAVHEAFDETTVEELREVFEALAEDEGVRVVVLRSTGKSFCAGADLSWMKRLGEQGREENERDALRLSLAFEAIAACPKPVVASVQGAALGGGAGLVAAADLAVASQRAVFGFTEVRLGILPAVIAPHVMARIGTGPAKALFLTGERFDAVEAQRLGLVHRVCAPDELDRAVGRLVRDLLCGSSEAQAAVKRLISVIAGASPAEARQAAASAIALARASRDGREGLTAFLAKRPPSWHPDAEERG